VHIHGWGEVQVLDSLGFALQDHHNPVSYRNIWVRLHRYDENAK
jgi:hypothetical protein